ncbi:MULTISPECIES: hypothetical protein [unclassified Mesorhizobium]|uniref:hypothetical protein n=1 Tax=unclassified Mesorhizobium TaxID=325217 RepID=UPI000BAFB916|nr:MULTISPECIES: hypothetical protein [unclassified Mesorhizobium]PBB23572.1 hypothetical protein CK232_26925 [Mesorhizobium sp. WSM4304]PBB72415.1 hypothetical protein CK227_26625 [Mesorhizobium sp. WSM4308]
MAQRQEAGTLAPLAEKDAVLVGQAELLRSMLEGVAGDAMLAGKREIEVGIAAITKTLRRGRRFCCEGGDISQDQSLGPASSIAARRRQTRR